MEPNPQNRKRLKARLTAFAFLVALTLILNPELRAVVFLANFLGLELFAVLLILQWRMFYEDVRLKAGILGSLSCTLSRRLGSAAFAALPRAIASQGFNRLICPALVVLSLGLTCQLSPLAPKN